MQVALPPGHPLAKRKAIKLEDLAEDDWLTGVSQGSCRDHLILLCQAAGFEPKISFESDDYQVLQGFVAAGMGVTLLPELALAGRHPDLELRPVTPKAPRRRVWATALAEGSRAPATDAMVEVLEEVGQRFRAGKLGGRLGGGASRRRCRRPRLARPRRLRRSSARPISTCQTGSTGLL